MKAVRFVIPGRPIVKKNGQKVLTVFKNGIKTKRKVNTIQYSIWQSLAAPYLLKAKQQVQRPLGMPLNASFRFYFKNRKSEADLSALYEGIQDELKTYGIIVDDRLIRAHNGSEKIFDPKATERIEVELVPLDEWKRKNTQKAQQEA